LSKITQCAVSLAAALTFAVLPDPVWAANRDALWTVVHDFCVPVYQAFGLTFPCLQVDVSKGIDRGFAVLPSPSGQAHIILVPTVRITGIESPVLLAPSAPNYWEAAWNARHFVEERVGRQIPRDQIGMAINSVSGRSQDQLHIHVACIAHWVTGSLHKHAAEIRETWTPIGNLLGQRFMAMKVAADDMTKTDPFKALARSLPSNSLMDRETLVVVGATFGGGVPGFYMLAANSRSPGNGVTGEALLDDKCEPWPKSADVVTEHRSNRFARR
jgi:CDP-diacylglycerol pyrophosphatase